MTRHTLALTALICLSGAAHAAAPDESAGRPRSVIFVMCDGMGPAMVSTIAELTLDSRGPLVMESMPVTGLIRTASLTGPITDSAAAATAYATGFKAANRALGWFPDQSTHATLAELAERAGKSTALMTTTDLTDASPAAFIARVPDRKLHRAVFEQMVGSSVDVLAGGLRAASLQTEGVPDNLTDETPVPFSGTLRATAIDDGRTVLTDPAALPDTTTPDTRILLAYPERSPYSDAFGPKLAQTLAPTLAMLGSNPRGFFVFAEVEETDNAGHANDTDRTIAGLIEGDEALRVALDYQVSHPDTLVILTADHDTGSFTLDNRGDYKAHQGTPMWLSMNHTATRVNVYAKGPGAERFTGVHDNTEVFTILADLMGLTQD